MARRRRGLTPEDRALWDRVSATAKPLHDRPPRIPEAEAQPPAKPRPAPPPPPAPLPDFRIGQTAPAAPGGVSRAPSPAEFASADPLRMDAGTHRKMVRGKMRPDARIDLHGMTLAQAHPALIGFILTCQSRGHRLVLVITGKGRRQADEGPLPTRPGALRHYVPQWLAMPPISRMVLQIRPAHLRHGGEGAYYVYLRRP